MLTLSYPIVNYIAAFSSTPQVQFYPEHRTSNRHEVAYQGRLKESSEL